MNLRTTWLITRNGLSLGESHFGEAPDDGFGIGISGDRRVGGCAACGKAGVTIGGNPIDGGFRVQIPEAGRESQTPGDYFGHDFLRLGNFANPQKVTTSEVAQSFFDHE